MEMKKIGLFFSLFAILAFGVVQCGGDNGGGGDETPSSDVTITFSPEDGATDQTGDVAVTATFSGAIDESTLTTDTFTLKRSSSSSNLCSAVSYDSATKTATCTHDNLEGGETYTVAVTGSVKDSSGRALSASSASFTVESTAPTASLEPTPTSGTIKVVFSEAIDSSTLTSTSLTVTDESGSICSDLSYDATTQTATCTISSDKVPACPEQGLHDFENYTVTLTDDITDLAGNALSTVTETISSLDDGFEEETLSDCWTTGNQVGFSFDTTTNDGSLTIDFPSQADNDVLLKMFSSSTFGVSIYFNALDPDNVASGDGVAIFIGEVGDNGVGARIGFVIDKGEAAGSLEIVPAHVARGSEDPTFGGTPLDLEASDQYFCLLRDGSEVSAFRSDTGESFSEAISLPDETLDPTAPSAFLVGVDSQGNGGDWAPQIDQIKFRKFGSGETPSCPTF